MCHIYASSPFRNLLISSTRSRGVLDPLSGDYAATRERIEALHDRPNFETRKRQERIDVETAVETIINIPGKSRSYSHSLSLSFSHTLSFSPSLSFSLSRKNSTTGLNNKWQISSVLDVRGEMIFSQRVRLSQRKYTRHAWTLSIVERSKKAVGACMCVLCMCFFFIFFFCICLYIW